MPKIVELRQDRSLIKRNFDGYKLSLDAIPVLRQNIKPATFRAKPSEDQYSLLHAELFSMHNLLYVDPWYRTQSYFVNCLGEVVRSVYNETTGRPDNPQVVFQWNNQQIINENYVERQSGDYNYSLHFISEKYCVLCDGICSIVLVDTSNRLKAEKWRPIANCKIWHNLESNEARGVIIYDCRLDILKEQKHISLALGHIEKNIHYHNMHVHWAKWIQIENKWNFSILDTLEGKGSLYYCAFEPKAESLIISSNRDYCWRSKIFSASTENNFNKPQLHDELNIKDTFGDISWSQTDEDLLIKFPIKPNTVNSDYHVHSSHNTLNVQCKKVNTWDLHELYDKIDYNLTTWTFEYDCLHITLVKQNVNVYWPSLFANGAGPKQSTESLIKNSDVCEEKPIVNLETPVEDCDFPIGSLDDDIKIYRYNLLTKSNTHTIMLNSPPLFTTVLRPGYPLGLAIRQDVDACLWLQQYQPSTKPDEWGFRHEGSLYAFGYIQASKQQKKFMDCSPDFSYAIICEAQHHIFLYKSKHDKANGLRNRSGNQITIGKQHLITLDDDIGEILGLCTANSVVTLLTENWLLYLQIN